VIALQTYLISFINHLEPNANRGEQIAWPRWETEGRNLMHFEARSPSILGDDFRAETFAALEDRRVRMLI
jgi:hypothetical protein